MIMNSKTRSIFTSVTTAIVAITMTLPEIAVASSCDAFYQSADMGAPDYFGGFAVTSSQFLGSRFTVTDTIQVCEVGGHIAGPGVFFAAIIEMDDALPTGSPFDRAKVVATTTFFASSQSSDVLTPLDVVLEPGNYALVFGSGLFGASGSGYMPWNNLETPEGQGSFFRWDGDDMAWQNSAQEGKRFVVRCAGCLESPCPADLNGNRYVGLYDLVNLLHGWGACEEVPSLLGAVDTPSIAADAVLSGTVAYVADAGSLQVLDVSDPMNPTILGAIETPGIARRVDVSGNVAYVADQSAGLQVIDVSDTTNPAILGSVDTPSSAKDVAVSGTVAYVADESFGLQAIDVSDPANPAILGSVDTPGPGSAQGVVVSGTVAYMADGGSGLQVIDVSDPANPAILGSVNPGYTKDVTVSGNIAYVTVAGGASGLRVIDVSVLANPLILGSVETPGSADTVAVSGNVAYVADGYYGLQIIDVSAPAAPAIFGSVNTWGTARGVTVSSTAAYVADGYYGLQVIGMSVQSCPADLNGNGYVGLGDLLILIHEWGPCP